MNSEREKEGIVTENKKRGRPPKNGFATLVDGEEINKSWEKVAVSLLNAEYPISVKEIADKASISKDMVYRYLKDEGFNNYLDSLILEEMRLSKAFIWKKLKEMCNEGNLSAMKLYFDLSKSSDEGAGDVIKIIDDVPELSASEIKNIFGSLSGEEELC